jgi:N-acetylmuramoyl-L-alanine amidase
MTMTGPEPGRRASTEEPGTAEYLDSAQWIASAAAGDVQRRGRDVRARPRDQDRLLRAREVLGVLLIASVAVGSCSSDTRRAGASHRASTTSSTTTSTVPATSSTAPPSVALPLAGKLIALDPGHDGGPVPPGSVSIGNGMTLPCDTSGTSSRSGLTESGLNLEVADQVRGILRGWGATVQMTRETNTGSGPCVDVRVRMANDAHADAAVSIHADGVTSSDAHGFHVIVPELIAGQTQAVVDASHRLGIDVRDAYAAATGLPTANYVGVDGINPRSDLANMNLTTLPRVLIEMGVLGAPEGAANDLGVLGTDVGRKSAARGIANGLAAFFGVSVTAG